MLARTSVTDTWLWMGQSETLGIWLERASGRQLLGVQGLCGRDRLYRWLWRADGKISGIDVQGCPPWMCPGHKAEDGALSFGPCHSSAGQVLFLNCVKESMI